jgi:hypothetical protein
MTLDFVRASAALSAKQLSIEIRAACQADTGTNRRIIALNSIQGAKTEMRGSTWPGWVAAHTGLQGRVRQEREDFLKRPNLLKQGMAGQLEDMSVND